jgi:hypothetical protein
VRVWLLSVVFSYCLVLSGSTFKFNGTLFFLHDSLAAVVYCFVR